MLAGEWEGGSQACGSLAGGFGRDGVGGRTGGSWAGGCLAETGSGGSRAARGKASGSTVFQSDMMVALPKDTFVDTVPDIVRLLSWNISG